VVDKKEKSTITANDNDIEEIVEQEEDDDENDLLENVILEEDDLSDIDLMMNENIRLG